MARTPGNINYISNSLLQPSVIPNTSVLNYVHNIVTAIQLACKFFFLMKITQYCYTLLHCVTHCHKLLHTWLLCWKQIYTLLHTIICMSSQTQIFTHTNCHTLTISLTDWLTHWLTHWLIHSVTHTFTHTDTHTFRHAKHEKVVKYLHMYSSVTGSRHCGGVET